MKMSRCHTFKVNRLNPFFNRRKDQSPFVEVVEDVDSPHRRPSNSTLSQASSGDWRGREPSQCHQRQVREDVPRGSHKSPSSRQKSRSMPQAQSPRSSLNHESRTAIPRHLPRRLFGEESKTKRQRGGRWVRARQDAAKRRTRRVQQAVRQSLRENVVAKLIVKAASYM